MARKKKINESAPTADEVKMEAEVTETPTTPEPVDFTPTSENVEAAFNNPDNAIAFVEPATVAAASESIILPWTAFFDQELGEVIFNKLMKAPVKDYQVLLRLSKLGKTINDISKKLANIRDAISKDCGLSDLAAQEASLTPEMLSSPLYQAKSRAFGMMIQKYIFAKFIDLAPLGTLTLDLTNPDGHAKAFIEWSSLSMDDIEMLDGLKIIKVIYPANEEKTDDTK